MSLSLDIDLTLRALARRIATATQDADELGPHGYMLERDDSIYAALADISDLIRNSLGETVRRTKDLRSSMTSDTDFVADGGLDVLADIIRRIEQVRRLS